MTHGVSKIRNFLCRYSILKMAAGELATLAENENLDLKNSDSNVHEKTFTLEILQIIKEAQQQHGLRHGDYQRYRGYCSRRLRRIRKSLHFVQGTKHRFQQKKVTVEILSDLRYLYIPLIMAERAWGYAMQLKQEANTEPRKKFHLVGRLQKAEKYAAELEKLCESSKCDARTKLESQAYHAWIKGLLLFEFQDWQPAMECFRKSQTIYEKLSSALTEDEGAIYKSRVEELTPNLRYCAYNIGDESAINDLMQMRLQGKGTGEDLIATDLDNLIAQTREKQAATLSEVTWLGRTIPVKQEKVRVFLLNSQESEDEVMKAPDLEAKIAFYERLLLDCKDSVQIVRDELKNDQMSKGRTADGQVSSLQFLHSYLVYIRLTKTIERNLIMIEVLKKNLPIDSSNVPKEGKAVTKPQDLIRPYEIIIQNLNDIVQLPGLDSHPDLIKEMTNKMLYFKAHRCFYLAQAFSVATKWTEAMALYQKSTEYILEAKNNDLDKSLLPSIDELKKQIEGKKYSVHAQSILAKEEPSSQIEQLNLNDKVPLFERLNHYSDDPTLLTKRPNIAQFPPDFKPIPCKPLFFDLALNHVEFPSLDDKLEQKKGGTISGFVKGLFGGWKK